MKIPTSHIMTYLWLPFILYLAMLFEPCSNLLLANTIEELFQQPAKNLSRLPRSQPRQGGQSSIFLRLGKQTAHRIKLGRGCQAAGTHAGFEWIKQQRQRVPEGVRHLGKGWGKGALLCQLSPALGHFKRDKREMKGVK